MANPLDCKGESSEVDPEPNAHVAQLVERVLGKDEVTGSTPVMGSRTSSGPAAGKLEKKRV